jgi:tol-pal system protein YbgF
MTRMRLLAVMLVLAVPAAASAQSRQDLQVTADLRMIQEQVNRLQLQLNKLDEEQRAISKRLDDQVTASQKASADQQLLINNLAGTVGTVRESLADNTTRVNQVMQELSSMRDGFRMVTEQLNTLVGLLQPPTNPSADGSIGAAPGAGGLPTVAISDSPTKVYNAAMNDYMANHLDNAIEGFTEYANKFPTAPNAADAQFFIGEAYYGSNPGKFREAIAAYDKVINNYKDSDRVPEAYYKQALCYLSLNQRTEAIRILRLIITKFPNGTESAQAQQKLSTLGVK